MRLDPADCSIMKPERSVAVLTFEKSFDVLEHILDRNRGTAQCINWPYKTAAGEVDQTE